MNRQRRADVDGRIWFDGDLFQAPARFAGLVVSCSRKSEKQLALRDPQSGERAFAILIPEKRAPRARQAPRPKARGGVRPSYDELASGFRLLFSAYVAERDAIFDGLTNNEGEYADEDDAEIIAEMDDVIVRAKQLLDLVDA